MTLAILGSSEGCNPSDTATITGFLLGTRMLPLLNLHWRTESLTARPRLVSPHHSIIRRLVAPLFTLTLVACAGGGGAPASPESALLRTGEAMRFGDSQEALALRDAALSAAAQQVADDWARYGVERSAEEVFRPIWGLSKTDLAAVERSAQSEDTVTLALRFHSGASGEVRVDRAEEGWRVGQGAWLAEGEELTEPGSEARESDPLPADGHVEEVDVD